MLDNPATNNIVIVGGGTAGWITAARLAAKFKKQKEQTLTITLIESPRIPTIGVGEGTWPTMRKTLKEIGVSETDFIRECDATFKQGAKFARWVEDSEHDYYYHPLMLPHGFAKADLVEFWQTAKNTDLNLNSFSNTVCPQEQICEMGLAPKLITSPEYGGIANYAYHLDAGKFATFLQKHCTQTLGVKHILDDVCRVNTHDNGDISSVSTEQNGNIAGELFVDCTGFNSLLLGKHYKVPFIDKSHILFIDNALAVQAPYQNEQALIASNTISTGQKAGWVWDIGLTTRRGIGYVYSSAHTTESNAEAELRQYLKRSHDGDFSSNTKTNDFKSYDTDKLELRKIPITSGHRQVFWQNNCVAIGLSAGFLEPLEASALVLVELSAEFLSEQFPSCRAVMNITAKRFNETFQYRWERIIDFLKLHYILTQRFNDDFWMDNRAESSIPQSLLDLLELWKYRAPQNFDFASNNEVFPAASYQYVLYGMGFRTEFNTMMQDLQNKQTAKLLVEQAQHSTQKALNSLPKHRDLLNKVRQFGFQTI